MKPFVIAIPSYRRRALFEKKTLAWLRSTDVPDALVHVVVSDHADAAAYADLGVRVLVPPRPTTGLTDKFNAIHHGWPAGTRVVVLEDDVQLVQGSKIDRPKPLLQAMEMFERAFAEAQGKLWGVVPHSNGFFFPGGVSTALRLIVAHCFGFTTTHNPALECTLPMKSDYERTCLHYVAQGGVTRINSVGVKTNSYTQAGGLQAEHERAARADLERLSVAELCRRWPHLLTKNEKKQSLFEEVSLRRSPTIQAEALADYQRLLDASNGVSPRTAPSWEPAWAAR